MRPRRPVDAALWQPSCVSHGRDPAGWRRAFGRGTDVRTGCDHTSAFAGVGFGQSAGPATSQRGQRLHVPQQFRGTPVSGDQRGSHENRVEFYLHRTSQRISEYNTIL